MANGEWRMAIGMSWTKDGNIEVVLLPRTFSWPVGNMISRSWRGPNQTRSIEGAIGRKRVYGVGCRVYDVREDWDDDKLSISSMSREDDNYRRISSCLDFPIHIVSFISSTDYQSHFCRPTGLFRLARCLVRHCLYFILGNWNQWLMADGWWLMARVDRLKPKTKLRCYEFILP